MRSLVTGGSGFIGSNLVNVLVDRGDEVTVLDDFSVGRMDHITDSRVEIVKGSVCDLDLMLELMSNTDTVFHLAVKCLVACNENPIMAHEVNVGGTFNACLAAHEAHAKVVYVSSSEVYGTCKVVPLQKCKESLRRAVDDMRRIKQGQSPLYYTNWTIAPSWDMFSYSGQLSMSESHPTEPQSIYGLSKLMGEEYIRFFNKYYGVPAVIIRPFNTYGPNHRNDQYAAVITAFIRWLENGEYPIIEGTGEQSRDFTYVTDTAEGIVLLSKLENGEIVNIGSGKAVSIKELAATLMKIYGMENKPIFAEPRPNDVFKLEADSSWAKAYGYKPRVSLEEGLKKYIAWWRKNA